MKQFDTLIVSGGSINDAFALDFIGKIISEENKKTYMIAADRGMEFFFRNRLQPDLIVGDFDSSSEKTLNYMEDNNVNVLRLKPEKDDSDTQSALMKAVELGAENVLILGATGTRIDHMIANLGLLLLGEKHGVHVTIVDPYNYIRLVKSGEILQRAEQFGDYVSFFPLGGDIRELTLQGFKYTLNQYDLASDECGRTVSNEFSEAQASVTYTSGELVMIQSRDRM